MRRVSKKRHARNKQARPVRMALLAKHKACMVCGNSPDRPRPGPIELSQLCCHEIACGPNRHKALDKPYACLVVCWSCNTALCDKARFPEARQLAILLKKAPEDYDLVKYLELTSPRAMKRIEQREVNQWLE